MASTFTSNTGIELIADGDQAGAWGQRTNDNFDIVDRALNGSVNIALSGTTGTVTTGQGSTTGPDTFGQFAVLVFTGSPSGTNTVTIAPNTAQKTYFVTNSTAETVVLSQGSGANVSVPAGLSKIVFTDGGGATAAVFDITNTLSGTFTGNLTGNLTGNVVSNADALIHGATVGRGAGAISTNTAVGSGALSSNTTGASNTATGRQALQSNTTASSNTANGVQALQNNTTGSNNTANGQQALQSNTTASSNTANGGGALRDNTTGSNNSANGISALLGNTTGNFNTANGAGALLNNTTGNANTANGFAALRDCIAGSFNTANGGGALQFNTTGSQNTANGTNALFDNTGGSNNIGIGVNAGRDALSPRTITTQSNEICIGNNDHTGAFIRIAFTVTSDARDKAELAPIQHGLDFINALQPTEYQFKAGGRDGAADGIRRYGFLAQDVLAAEGDNPVIVNNDDPDSLKMTHDYLLPVLVNAVKELMAEVAALKGQ